ncbi:unnamed protein product [Durusdinium trenchii]|uniref:Uncharacterized protein n=1 Tax=Durusdinium trenchii TaxID=1381693 RepID=A0ABP0MVV8_9DINO
MAGHSPNLPGSERVQQIVGAGGAPSLSWGCPNSSESPQRAPSMNACSPSHAAAICLSADGFHGGIQKLGQRLNGAQAAQARGSPEALSSAAVEIMVLQQCSSVLGENCEKYADLLERVGFTLGDDLEKVSDALLESLDRLQAFSDAVARLRAAAEAAPAPGISCRASGGYHEDLD